MLHLITVRRLNKHTIQEYTNKRLEYILKMSYTYKDSPMRQRAINTRVSRFVPQGQYGQQAAVHHAQDLDDLIEDVAAEQHARNLRDEDSAQRVAQFQRDISEYDEKERMKERINQAALAAAVAAPALGGIAYAAPKVYAWAKEKIPRAAAWAKEKYGQVKKRLTGRSAGRVAKRKVASRTKKPRGKSAGTIKKRKVSGKKSKRPSGKSSGKYKKRVSKKASRRK